MSKLIKESVSRFLGWKLPSDFAPDAGITFQPQANADSRLELQYRHEPTGTNLFNDPQATDMLTYVCRPLLERIEGLEVQVTELPSAAITDADVPDKVIIDLWRAGILTSTGTDGKETVAKIVNTFRLGKL